MSIIKVKNLAEELEVSIEEVLEQLGRLYVDAEDGNSPIDEKIASLVRVKMGRHAAPPKSAVKEKKAKVAAAKPEKPTEGKTKTKKKAKSDKTEADLPAGELKGPDAAKKEEAPSGEKNVSQVQGEQLAVPKTPASELSGPGGKVQEKAVPVPAAHVFTRTPEEEKKDKRGKPAREVVDNVHYPKGGRARGKGRNAPAIEIVEKGKFKPFVRGQRRDFKHRTPDEASALASDAKTQVSRKIHQKIQMNVPASVRDVAPKINVKPNAIIQYLISKNIFANINEILSEDMVREVMEYFGYELEIPKTIASIQKELVSDNQEESKRDAESRAPVVTFMGHVDHGKTSLLDYIRKTMVTKGEKGGITQHIGAYKVETSKGSITFLDTPGHAAFTSMRARGAHVTDIVVLVVAADDGVMPQTKEAIDHARAADVPIVVAINKCDLPNANPDRVKKSLQQEGLAPEAWGGKTIMVEVSAISGEGVDNLLEMLMLEAEMLELKATPGLRARGVVIESKRTADQGVVATLLVQNGTLHPGDIVLCGQYSGKTKAMIDELGRRVASAPPSTPVEVLGLQGLPEAGDEFFVVKDEKKAKTLSMLKQDEGRSRRIAGNKRVTLEDLHKRILEGSIKELKIILKADVQGSIEALKYSLEELATSEVKVDLIHSGVGNVNESDIMLAIVSNAIILGFHVKTDTGADEIARSEKVDVRHYDIIYEAIADIKAGMEGLLEPEEREVFQGRMQVKEIFTSSKAGKAAGCVVLKGTIHRKDKVRVKRGQDTVFDGEIYALRRFKDDVKDVKEGFECGLSLKDFTDLRVNDVLEAYTIERIARRLEKK